MPSLVRNTLFLAACLLAGAGCGPSGPQIVPVEGKLTLDGKPLDNVLVEFLPEPEAGVGARRSFGRTGTDGVFHLRYDDQKGGDMPSGAVVGSHRVLLTDLNPLGTEFLGRKADDSKPRPGAKPARFGKEYSDIAQPKFRKTVGPGATTITIELKDAAP
jgi:hypothetical protein